MYEKRYKLIKFFCLRQKKPSYRMSFFPDRSWATRPSDFSLKERKTSIIHCFVLQSQTVSWEAEGLSQTTCCSTAITVVCAISSIVLFSNHRPCLERHRVSPRPSVVSIAIRVVCVLASIVSFSNHRKCLEINRVSRSRPAKVVHPYLVSSHPRLSCISWWTLRARNRKK